MNKLHYKEYPKMSIGESDTASLTVRYPYSSKAIHFEGEGKYEAYVVDENAEIDEHYKLIHSGRYWVRILPVLKR